MPLGYIMRKEDVLAYYGQERADVAQALLNYGRDRNVMMTTDPGVLGGGGGQPGFKGADEILALVRGAMEEMDGSVPRKYPSFHGTMSRRFSTTGFMKKTQRGADLVIDIDVKDNYKVAFKEGRKVLDFLDSYNAPYRVKFSGGTGPHIIIPYEAFPESVAGGRFDRVHNMLFKIITSRSRAGHVDGSFTSLNHFYRMPYSLNENTGLVSLPLRHEQYDDFTPSMAEAWNVEVDEEWFQEPDDGAKEAIVEILRDGSGRSKEINNLLRKTDSGDGERSKGELVKLQKQIEEHEERLQKLAELQAPAKVIRQERQMLRDTRNALRNQQRGIRRPKD